MRTGLRGLLLGVALLGATATLAPAQDGFALKGSLVFNRSDVDASRESGVGSVNDLPDAAGFNLGAEYVVGPLGIGIAGYQAGNVRDYSLSEGSLNFLAEANYFLKLPVLPLSPYAGVHVGLGSYKLGDLDDRPRPEVDFGDLGYQLGVRFQPTRFLGLDAQYRRVSGSLADVQDSRFETNQFVVGVTLF